MSFGGKVAPALPYAYTQNVYILKRQALSLLGARSRMYDANGNLLFYCERKAFKLKEDIRVYADEARQTLMLSIRARSIIDFGATYDVTDARSNETVGAMRRKGMKSILRDEWEFLGPGDESVGRLVEDNAFIALMRRTVNLVSLFAPQSYTIEIRGQRVGLISQNFNPLTLHYRVDLTGDPGGMLDRRMAVAAAILLLNIEGRQS
jgi:uncharacterized protein YxjI